MKAYNKLDFRIGMVNGKVDYDETLKLSKMNPEQFVGFFGGEDRGYYCLAHSDYGFRVPSSRCGEGGCDGIICPLNTEFEICKTKLAEWLERAKADIAKDSKATEPVTPSYNVGDTVWYVDFGGMIREDIVASIIIRLDSVDYNLNGRYAIPEDELYSNKADALAGILNINKVDIETKLTIEE